MKFVILHNYACSFPEKWIFCPIALVSGWMIRLIFYGYLLIVSCPSMYPIASESTPAGSLRFHLIGLKSLFFLPLTTKYAPTLLGFCHNSVCELLEDTIIAFGVGICKSEHHDCQLIPAGERLDIPISIVFV